MKRDAFVFVLIESKWVIAGQFGGDDRIAGAGSFERACRQAQDFARELREEYEFRVEWATDRDLSDDFQGSVRRYGDALARAVIFGRNLAEFVAEGEEATERAILHAEHSTLRAMAATRVVA